MATLAPRWALHHGGRWLLLITMYQLAAISSLVHGCFLRMHMVHAFSSRSRKNRPEGTSLQYQLSSSVCCLRTRPCNYNDAHFRP
ncbi:hypothetical protein BV20DRAFT_65013 [Pilatotrama ljubarskyi]|nr:hypothetical protein BV20DRAFT_65013 [Pilatotrama ljubarskyi]